MAALSRLSSLVFIIAIPVFLVTTNVRFLASEPRFYERGFREYDAVEATGIPLSELDRSANEIVDYFEDDAGELRIVVAQDGQEVSLFNPRETQHMHDVKKLMRVVYRLNEISLAVIISYIGAVYLWSRERSFRRLAVQGLLGVATGAVVLGAVGAFAAFGFDAAWTRFHELVFQNDLWRLDPSRDHLIQMFPEPFWEEATLFVGLATLGEALLIVAVSATYLVFTRQRTVTEARPPAEARVRSA